MPAWGACLLGSINLSEFVVDKSFDFEEFKRTIIECVYALNCVLDEGIEKHPIEQQKETARNWRQIGLGMFGLADMLIKMEIKYGSNESLELCDEIGKTLSDTALNASAELAEIYGAFPKCDINTILQSNFIKANASKETLNKIRIHGLRNSQILTVPPTGSTATMLRCSTSLEPNFANYYLRTTKSLFGKDITYKVYAPLAEKYIKENNLTDTDELPEYFVTAHTIPTLERIKMQSTWQKHIDASISSTINLPHEATVEDVEDLYKAAWSYNLKGITIFRDGCKRLAILSTDTKKSEEEAKPETKPTSKYDSIKPISRKSLGTTSGKTYCKKCACGTLYITVNTNDGGDIVETFVHTSKGGVCQANLNGLNRMISTSLRSGVMVSEIVDQLSSINCPACATLKGKGIKLDGMSCPDIIARTIKEFAANKNTEPASEKEESPTEKCPECGKPLHHEGGCVTCMNCGWSRCG